MSVFVVCEGGLTNYGDPDLARRQIDTAVEARADAIKFIVYETSEFVSRRAAADRRDELGFDWYERHEERRLSWEALRELKRHADARGITFFASPRGGISLAFLVEELDVPLLKIGSGEASNWEFLRQVGAAGRPVQISFGLQSDEEALRAVETLRDAGAPEVTAFHTVSLYPTPPELAWLARIERLRDLLDVPVGISDHTAGWHVVLAAVARGAAAVEKHLTFDKADPRSLDNAGALEPDEFAAMVRQIREVERAIAPPDRARLENELARSRDWAAQAVVAARDLPAGHVVAVDDVATKRPARGGIPAAAAETVIGRRLRRALAADEQIRADDLA